MICFFGHHKCASSWTVKILRKIGNIYGLKVGIDQSTKSKDLDYIKKGKYDMYLSLNSVYSKIEELNFNKAFHVIRDPRDVIVSAYFSHLHSHSTKNWPKLRNHREKLASLTKDDGLLAEIDFSSNFLEHMSSWNYNDKRILEVKMESLVESPYTYFIDILDHLELIDTKDITQTQIRLIELLNRGGRKLGFSKFIKTKFKLSNLESILEIYSFEKLSGGRKRYEENQKSHYRKGAKNDWINHLNEKHIERLDELFPNLVARLGYED